MRDALGVYPPDVSVGGWHWLVDRLGEFQVLRWSTSGFWRGDDSVTPSGGLANPRWDMDGWRYVGPCPLPDEARAVSRVFSDELGNEVRV